MYKDNTVTVHEMLDIFYRHDGRDTGFEEVPKDYEDVYENLIQTKAEFDERLMILLFDMMESYRDIEIFDKSIIKDYIERSKENIEVAFASSIDPSKSTEHLVNMIDGFLDGDDLDTVDMFVLHVKGIYEMVNIEDML